jgi:hypothetical protein
LIDDAITVAGKSLDGVNVIDLSDYFCSGQTCHSVIGNVLVYADGNHMTTVYSATLAPVISHKLEELDLVDAN